MSILGRYWFMSIQQVFFPLESFRNWEGVKKSYQQKRKQKQILDVKMSTQTNLSLIEKINKKNVPIILGKKKDDKEEETSPSKQEGVVCI